jgi:hypothetical protein
VHPLMCDPRLRVQPSVMDAQTGVALVLTLFSALAVNWGYLTEHGAASTLPPLSFRRPLRSVSLLLGNRRWLLGFASETFGFVLFVVAVALAPLALVQAVAAGGIGVLALLVSRTTGSRLDGRERTGVAVAIFGLALLGISLAGGTEHGHPASWTAIVLWLGASGAVAATLMSAGVTRAVSGAAAFGLASGVLFAAGDVATKVTVSDGGHLAVAPAMALFYGCGTVALQMGFQRGRALTAAGIAQLGTNAIPIVAAMTIFREPLPGGVLGVLRVVAFVAVVAGAVALAPRRGGDDGSSAGPYPSAAPAPASSAPAGATQVPAVPARSA